MKKLLFDTESTGLIHNSASEIIEAFFLVCDDSWNELDKLHLKVAPELWESDAEKIHGITEKEAMQGMKKIDACNKLNEFFKQHDPFITYMYVNPIAGVYYDCAVLRLMYFDAGMLYDYYKWFTIDRIVSAYTLAKEELKERGYAGKSFKQEAVYKWLFGKSYNSHRAQDDVYAMRDILVELESKQMRLI